MEMKRETERVLGREFYCKHVMFLTLNRLQTETLTK